MKDIWFGDKRDLIKWSVLLHLADRINADRIVQIAYYRPGDFEEIDIDGERIEIRREVKSHFRDIRSIMRIGSSVKITVFDRPFEERRSYLEAAIEFIRKYSKERCVIFLDPDTGLQSKKPDFKHVLENEVRLIWGTLKENEIFAFYQHQTNRSGEPWVEQKREQLARALGVDMSSVKVASAKGVISDVVLFYCQK